MDTSAAPRPDNASMARLRQALERELAPDEAVQWHGWQLGRIDPRAFLLYVFAVPWTAFSLFWTVMAAAGIAASGLTGLGLLAWAFPLFGLPFIAVGAWMLSRPFVPLWERGRVLYVVTDRRVLKLALGRELVVKTVPAERIGLAERRERAGGTGTLSLPVRIGRDSDGDRTTETFDIGPVADIMGAQEAMNRIAAGARLAPGGPAGALSS
ncbi:hypothetical protein ACLBKU_14320 [Erythrobacter sp. NE805]|uniref:hypothetical protein n=1 Tax=Erythrobacter sp. NE805 TaxID=3389875 RepID=UPI00396B0E4C